MAASSTVSVTWSQALRWRLGRQFVDPPGTVDAVAVAARLCGVQAQVPSAAEVAVAVRTATGWARPATGGPAAGLATGLADGRLVRTWAARGTLHVLPVEVAARQLSLLAAARTWHKGSWQRTFAPLPVMTELAELVTQALDAGPLSREELVAAVGERRGHDDLGERLRSGWSTLLKPLAWQGLLCQGPMRGRNVTFARPDRLLPGWPGLPQPEDAGPSVVRDYLSAFGPATIESFDAWLLRGATGRTELRRWLAALDGQVTEIDVEGRRALLLNADADELASTPARPGAVHLLPAFDQYVLGAGTADVAVVPAEHRALVSRPGGWISPVVLLDGRVAGTWEAMDGVPLVRAFPGVDLPATALTAAVDRIAGLMARRPVLDQVDNG